MEPRIQGVLTPWNPDFSASGGRPGSRPAGVWWASGGRSAHDGTTTLPAVASLIDLGLCPPGPDAGAFMTLPNLTAPAGALPVNTAGGNLAEGFVHGIGLVLEAVRQIRGTSANQVPGAAISLLLGGPVAPLVSTTVFGSRATV